MDATNRHCERSEAISCFLMKTSCKIASSSSLLAMTASSLVPQGVSFSASMLEAIEDVTEKIIKSYDPERIILPGSSVAGRTEGKSNIALLIVKETQKRPIGHWVEVERSLSDRLLPLDTAFAA